MKNKALFFSVLLVICYNNQVQCQWGALGKLFVREAGETTAAKAAVREWEREAAARAAARYLEESKRTLTSGSYPTGSWHTGSANLEGFDSHALGKLNETERNKLNTYIMRAPAWEKIRVKYMNADELKTFVGSLGTPSIEKAYTEPTLAYSETTVAVQEELQKLGYRVQADGRFGAQTKRAALNALKKPFSFNLSNAEVLELSRQQLFEGYKSKFIALNEGPFVSRLEFNHGNSLAISKRIHITNEEEVNNIADFYNGFFASFDNKKNEAFGDSRFLTVCKTETGTYVGYHYKNPASKGVNGGLFNFTGATAKERDAYFDLFFKDPSVKTIYIYGDDASGISSMIADKARLNKTTVIHREPGWQKSFEQTEISIKRLAGKKITGTKLTFLNGTPDSGEEAVFQSFDEAYTGMLQSLYKDVNDPVLPKNASVIKNKDELIQEITTGDNDFLFIVAHSDGENIYFGSSVLNMEELKALPVRKGRTKSRTAILFSCTTGNISPSFINDPKSFAGLLVDKNFFDLVIAPPGNLNGNDILRMIDVIDKYPVLELNKHFSQLMDEGQMINLAEILQDIKNSTFVYVGKNRRSP